MAEFDAIAKALHPKISNVSCPPRLQRILDNAANELMQWSAERLAGLPKPPEITVVGFVLQANTVTLTLQRKAPVE